MDSRAPFMPTADNGEYVTQRGTPAGKLIPIRRGTPCFSIVTDILNQSTHLRRFLIHGYSSSDPRPEVNRDHEAG